MGLGIVGVAAEGPIEVIDCSFAIVCFQPEHPSEVEILGCGVDGAIAGKACLLLGSYFDTDLIDDRLRYLTLPRVGVGKVADIGMGHDGTVGASVDQLGADTDFVAVAQNAAFHYGVYG